MAAKKISPIEEHFEKAILALSVVILLYVLFSYMFSTPIVVTIDGETVRPGQAYSLLLEKAQQIENRAASQEWPKQLQSTEMPTADTPELTLLPIKGLPVAVLPTKKIEEPELTILDIKEKVALPQVLAPSKPATTKGKSTISIVDYPEIGEILNVTDTEVDVNWVAIASQIDVEKQKKILENLPDAIQPREPIYLRVDLQRAEILPDGTLGEWKDIPPINKSDLLIPPDKPLKVNSMIELAEIRNTILSNPATYEAAAVRPPFPQIIAGTEWEEPLLPGEEKIAAQAKEEEEKSREPERRERRRIQPIRIQPEFPERAGIRGGGRRAGLPPATPPVLPEQMGRPIQQPLYGRGYPQQPRGLQPQLPEQIGPVAPIEQKLPRPTEYKRGEKTIKLLAYDITAEPGKTYIYRVRVVMYNPLAGYKPYLKDPSQNLLVGIVSDWSEPTDPVKIEKDMYFFVRDLTEDGKGITVSVYKWYKGLLCKENFTVWPGDQVGWTKTTTTYNKVLQAQQRYGYELTKEDVNFSTGAILLDVNPAAEILLYEPFGRSGEFDIRKITVPQATFRLPDGSIIIQDPESIRYTTDYKNCMDINRKQRIEIQKNLIKD